MDVGTRLGRQHARTEPSRLPEFLFALAGIHFAGGIYCLWLNRVTQPRGEHLAAIGVVLILFGCVQFFAWQRGWRRGDVCTLQSVLVRGVFWRWLTAAVLAGYVVGLAAGSPRIAPFLVWTVLATWSTFLAVLLSAGPVARRRIASRFSAVAFRLVGWTVYGFLMVAFAGEVGLRLYALAIDDPVSAGYMTDQRKLPPGLEIHGQTANAHGYWDDEFDLRESPGMFRVAALGDDLAMCGSVETNFLSRLERQVAGLEICNFALSGAGPREYAAQLARDVPPVRPDLVLIVLSIGTDITHELPLPGLFDWRGLHLVQRSAQLSGRTNTPLDAFPPETQQQMDHNAYLNWSLRSLTVCRTPMDEAMRTRWREVYRHLDDLVARCRRSDLAPALVLVPGEFQVNEVLLRTICRRAGYAPRQLDLELPQRRLVCYAKKRRLPVVDLLPHFRLSDRRTFQRNDCRLSDEGHTIAADIIGGWLGGRQEVLMASAEQLHR